MSAIKPALVGAFVLSGIAMTVAVILLFGASKFFSPTLHAVVYFTGSVANLDVGAPVTFRGVQIGSVTSVVVSLNTTDLTAQIPVYLDLDPSQISLRDKTHAKTAVTFERLLSAGLKAQLTMKSLLTGQLLVDLDFWPNSPAIYIKDDSGRTEIPSVPSRMQTIESAIADLPLRAIADNLNQTLSEIRHLTDTLSPKLVDLADGVTQTALVAQTTLQDIDRLAITSRQQIGANGDRLQRVLDRSDQTLKDSDAVVRSLQEMTAQDSPMRSDLDATLRDLAASASALRGFTHDIERDPGVLISGRAGR